MSDVKEGSRRNKRAIDHVHHAVAHLHIVLNNSGILVDDERSGVTTVLDLRPEDQREGNDWENWEDWLPDWADERY